MLAERTNGKMISDKKSRFRRLVWIVGSLILVMPVIFIMAYVWLVPHLIRREVERGLSEFFEGAVEIESVEVNHSGKVTLGGLKFCDTAKRRWLFAGKVKAILANWPSLSPKIAEIEVDGLNLQFFTVDGKFITLPVRLPERSASPKNRFDFRKLSVSHAAVSIVDAQGSKAVYDNLTLSAIRIVNGDYEFSLNRMSGDSSEIFLSGGTVNLKNSNFDVSLQLEHRFTKAEMTLAFVVLNMPEVSARGSLSGDLSITGCLKKPADWQPKGTFRLRNWLVEEGGAVAWSALNTDLEVKPSGFDFDNLSICDANGLEWLRAESAKLTFEDWPGARPVLTEVEAKELTLRTYLADGKLSLPVQLPSKDSTSLTSSYLDLQRLVLHNASIGIVGRPNAKITCDYLSLQPDRQEGFYDVLLTLSRPQQPEPSKVRLKGIINPTSSEVRLSLEIDHRAKKQETAVVFAALGIPQLTAEGKVAGDLTIAGCLNEPLGLQPSGSVRLDECVLFFKGEVLADNLVTTAKLYGRRLELDKFSAVVCKGRVSGSFHAEVKENRLMEFRGRVLAVNVSFPEFTSVLTAKAQKATTGTFTGSYNFSGQHNSLNALNGEGLLVFDDADISVLPVIPTIFRFVGLSQFEPLKMSDAEAIFSTTGPVVTIQTGHISNRFAAIEFEPGGTVNLQARQIDGHVVVAPISQIAGAIEKLPVINIFARLKDKLMRLHVKGDWSDTPSKLIKKEPIKDLKDSTTGFIQDVVKSGGQFGRGMLDRLSKLLKTNENKSK